MLGHVGNLQVRAMLVLNMCRRVSDMPNVQRVQSSSCIFNAFPGLSGLQWAKCYEDVLCDFCIRDAIGIFKAACS